MVPSSSDSSADVQLGLSIRSLTVSLPAFSGSGALGEAITLK